MALFLSHFRRKGIREGEAPFMTTHASITERELPVPTALGFAGSEVTPGVTPHSPDWKTDSPPHSGGIRQMRVPLPGGATDPGVLLLLGGDQRSMLELSTLPMLPRLCGKGNRPQCKNAGRSTQGPCRAMACYPTRKDQHQQGAG